MGAIALGLFATSCSNNDEVEDPAIGGGDDLKGYLTLQIANPEMPSARTGDWTPGRIPGTTEENAINDVTVVLTNATGQITDVVSTAILSGTTTKKFEVAAGSHKVYALVNNPGIATIVAGQNIAQVIDNATVAEITSGFKGGKFFMTNAQHDKTKSVLDAGVDVSISAGQEKLATIAVDRLAARIEDATGKVAITGLPDDQEAIMDSVKVIGFVPMNLNPAMNIIQTWGTANVGGTNDPEVNEILQTPTPSSYLLPASTYMTANSDGIGLTDLTAEPQFVKKVYVTENRPAVERNSFGLTAKRGETTAVIYRVVAYKGGNPLPTFYTYNDVVYTTRTALDDAFELVGEDISALSIQDLRAKNIKVYENGVMYYTYFIKDPNTNYQLGTDNYFGVFRNSIYRLNITGIKSLGTDVPEDEKDPEDLVNPEEAYLSVELVINDWVLNTIDIEFP